MASILVVVFHRLYSILQIFHTNKTCNASSKSNTNLHQHNASTRKFLSSERDSKIRLWYISTELCNAIKCWLWSLAIDIAQLTIFKDNTYP